MSNSIVTQRFIKCHNKLREIGTIRSSRQFALQLEYLPQSLSEILKGRRDVTIELLRKAVESYKINPVYVYTGEGPMFMSEEGKLENLVILLLFRNFQLLPYRIINIRVERTGHLTWQEIVWSLLYLKEIR